MVNRRSLLLGLGAALAAPAVIRTPGLLMPVRRLSAAEIDPADINGIIAELPDGAYWYADPSITYWAEGSINVTGKRGVVLSGARVLIRKANVALRIGDCVGTHVKHFHIDRDDRVDLGLPSAPAYDAGWYSVAFDAPTLPA